MNNFDLDSYGLIQLSWIYLGVAPDSKADALCILSKLRKVSWKHLCVKS